MVSIRRYASERVEAPLAALPAPPAATAAAAAAATPASAKVEGGPSYLSVSSIDPGAFITGLIGSTRGPGRTLGASLYTQKRFILSFVLTSDQAAPPCRGRGGGSPLFVDREQRGDVRAVAQGLTIVHCSAQPQLLSSLRPPSGSLQKALTLSREVDEWKPLPWSWSKEGTSRSRSSAASAV